MGTDPVVEKSKLAKIQIGSLDERGDSGLSRRVAKLQRVKVGDLLVAKDRFRQEGLDLPSWTIEPGEALLVIEIRQHTVQLFQITKRPTKIDLDDDWLDDELLGAPPGEKIPREARRERPEDPTLGPIILKSVKS